MTAARVSLDRARGPLTWMRALALVEAAERASLTPIPLGRLHAFAYLADTLSPVWGLIPFDKVALKTKRTPYFGEFQETLDDLVLLGLLTVTSFSFEKKQLRQPLLMSACYTLAFDNPSLKPLLKFIEEDPQYARLGNYLESVAVALSRLRDDEIDEAATRDAAWENPDIPAGDVVQLRSLTGEDAAPSATQDTVRYFDELKNDRIKLSGPARLRLYVSYLSERLKAA